MFEILRIARLLKYLEQFKGKSHEFESYILAKTPLGLGFWGRIRYYLWIPRTQNQKDKAKKHMNEAIYSARQLRTIVPFVKQYAYLQDTADIPGTYFVTMEGKRAIRFDGIIEDLGRIMPRIYNMLITASIGIVSAVTTLGLYFHLKGWICGFNFMASVCTHLS